MTTSPPRPARSHHRRLVPVGFVTLLAALCLAMTPAVSSAASSPQAQVRSAWAQLKSSLVNKSPSAFCGILTAHAGQQLVADVKAKPKPTSCTAAAADLFKVAGGPALSKIRLLTVKVTGNTAQTTDTGGPPPDQWVRTGKTTWKIASLPRAFG
jgi:hypothetical protein